MRDARHVLDMLDFVFVVLRRRARARLSAAQRSRGDMAHVAAERGDPSCTYVCPARVRYVAYLRMLVLLLFFLRLRFLWQ